MNTPSGELAEHRAVRSASKVGVAVVRTTTVDVRKLHGTLSRLAEARFTVNNVFSPLKRDTLRSTRDSLRGRTLIVVGYGGEDEFDVIRG